MNALDILLSDIAGSGNHHLMATYQLGTGLGGLLDNLGVVGCLCDSSSGAPGLLPDALTDHLRQIFLPFILVGTVTD